MVSCGPAFFSSLRFMFMLRKVHVKDGPSQNLRNIFHVSISSITVIKSCINIEVPIFYRKCRHKQTRNEYAVKIVSRRLECNREVQLLRLCQGHPNIVKIHDVFHDEVSETFQGFISRLLPHLIAVYSRNMVS